ncbi:MAG: efflux RND transporter periplasmic adaptor subunit [Desulfuromonadaceae bacterium]|nr:efflux RND transporter periplasmic adaptor subunit [Desulfuromonadaceae bacterium]MDD2850177.1 efflux RND transporter periplasmic adaptor subunit [Desulfuromonadaceae bacterium]MDD4129699.1 efflux RND transporter periplasmic adaptor subunit [Desulfuromonadaceae bacterium]
MNMLLKRISYIGLGVVVVIAAYLSYQRWFKQPPFPDGLIQANGRIEGDQIAVAGKFSGRIATLIVREGAQVQAGQVMAVLEDTQVRARATQANEALASLDARIQAGKTNLAVFRQEVPLMIAGNEAAVAQASSVVNKAVASEEQARRDAGRFKELAERGSVDLRRSEQVELAWVAARNDLEAAQGALIRARKQLSESRLGPQRIKAKEDELAAITAQRQQARGVLAEAESVLNDLTIRAPVSGIVMTRMKDVGEVVAAGAPLFDLVDMDRLYLKAYVAEVHIGKLRLGLPARISTDAFPKVYFPATVKYISSRAEFTPKEVQTPDERVKLVYAVKMYLDSNRDRRLSPGLPADAVIRWKDGTPWATPRW